MYFHFLELLVFFTFYFEFQEFPLFVFGAEGGFEVWFEEGEGVAEFLAEGALLAGF